jgi:Predicted pPIWI-associating nuclease
MTQRPFKDGPDPELLRRLREFQLKVRRPPNGTEASATVKPLLSEHQASVIARLRRYAPALADSLEQALRDLNDRARLSYVGPAAEVREAMRAAVQLFAPDDEVRKEPWFKGITQGNKQNPSQAERIRYAVQRRGGSTAQAVKTNDLIDQLIGEIGRETYASGSSAIHAGTVRARVRKLSGWAFMILDEILPD